MKLALRYIPTEVWVDVICYPWITRWELGRIVHKFRNRKFVEILQYCLHDRGKRTLRGLILNETELKILPRTPMPENIKFFERIDIGYFDSRTLDFLRRISTLFLTNEVNLRFNCFQSYALTNLHTILDHLTPLLHGIHSMAFNQRAIPLVQQYFTAKLAQVKRLSLNLDPKAHEPFDPATNQALNFCLNWLTSAQERNPTEPKFLEVNFCLNVEQFSNAIEQQFQSATRPSTFVIKFNCYDHEPDFQLDLKNAIGEQLYGQFDRKGDYWNEKGNYWIFRHPVGSTRAQLQEWVKAMVERSYKSSVINIFSILTIGQIGVNAGDNEGNDAGEEEEAEKPTISECSIN